MRCHKINGTFSVLLGILQGVGDEGSSEAVGVAKVGKKKKSKAAAAGGPLDGTKKPPQQKRLHIMNAKVVLPCVSFPLPNNFGFQDSVQKALGPAV